MSDSYVFGWTGEVYRADLLAEPQAPSNWKDPVKIERYVAEKRQERDAKSALIPIVGRVNSLIVMDSAGHTVFDGSREDSVEPLVSLADRFLQFAVEHFNLPSGMSAAGLDDPQPYYFGINIKSLFRELALELMSAGCQHVPPRFWYNTQHMYDPYEMLVESGSRNDIDIYALCEFLDVMTPGSGDTTYGLTTARELVDVAFDLCKKANLL